MAETEIEQNYLLVLLDTNETIEGQQVLDSLSSDAAAEICEFLLPRLRHLQSVIFVSRFMMQSIAASLPPGRMRELEDFVLGASMLLQLPEEMQVDPGFRGLICRPQRIVEQLLMNTQIELATTILNGFSDAQQSEIITKSFHVPSSPEKKDGSSNPIKAHRRSKSTAPGLDGFEHDLISFYAEKSLQNMAINNVESVPADLDESGLILRQRSGMPYNSMNVTATQPVAWVLDEDARACMVCQASFVLLINGRHHCRHCGQCIAKYQSKWRNIWIRDVFCCRHLWCRGSQPKHASNPA